MQSKKQSFIESIINVAVGYSLAVIAQIIVLPFFGANIKVIDNMIIGLIMTVLSIARSYGIRRLFNNNIFRLKTIYMIQSAYWGVYIVVEIKTFLGYQISYETMTGNYPLSEAGYQKAEDFIEDQKNK